MSVGQLTLVRASGRTPARARASVFAKRLVDVTASLAALVLLSPLLALLWVVIRLESRGPALFRQERLGLRAEPFTMYKFRSMRTDADDAIHRAYVTQLLTGEVPETGGSSGLFKIERDPRITRVGAFIRRTSLDELPQLFNVLRGDMSLVGPRPALAWEAEMYEQQYWRRFDAMPGVTGLWQISGRNALTMRQALDLDLEYVGRQSTAFDLEILLRTVPSLVRSQAR